MNFAGFRGVKSCYDIRSLLTFKVVVTGVKLICLIKIKYD
jgi:hypothetical protein